jgi:hypothetical protein
VLDKLQRRTLMSVLEQAPGKLEDLEVTITRTDSMRPMRLGTSGHTERAVPFNQRASDARVKLEKALRTYALRVAIVVRVPAPHKPAAQALYLRRWLPGIPDDAPSIEGIYNAIVGTSDAARRAVDRPADRKYIGVCTCGTSLYAVEGGSDVIECRGCKLRWSVNEQRAWLLEQARDRVGSPEMLAKILPWFDERPIKASTIRKWAERGKLEAVNPQGHYRIGDVIALHRGATPETEETAAAEIAAWEQANAGQRATAEWARAQAA